MNTTLAGRIKDRMSALELTNAQLAAACRVAQPTSFNWASGKTQNIKGEPLLLAAEALGVTPSWLATGKGNQYPEQKFPIHRVEEPGRPHLHELDEWTAEAVRILSRLAPLQREGAVAVLRTHIGNLFAPEHSPTQIHTTPATRQRSAPFRYKKLNQPSKPLKKKSA